MPATITASMLYDLVQCPHRVALDLFGDAGERDPVSPFVQLLWDRGYAFERETIAALAQPLVDLSGFSGDERERHTREAISSGAQLIYAGRLTHDDLVGEPDLLRRLGTGYVPGDIKSGAGEEARADRIKLKTHYAVQLALYVDILEREKLSAVRVGFVWDVRGDEIAYDLAQPQGPGNPASWWDKYTSTLESARRIASDAERTSPANASICKQCHWRSRCLAELRATNDLSLLPALGRSKRDALVGTFATVRDLAAADLTGFIKKSKTSFPRIGAESLRKMQERARLLSSPNPRPYRTAALPLPTAAHELFFDIEVDTVRDLCYLHGFVERTEGRERYVAFFAEHPTPEAEGVAFAAAWAFVQGARPCAVYYYSHYERTYWLHLQSKHPSVCSAEAVEELFDDPLTVDLYTSIVKTSTEWPTLDYSLKTLAKFLGFAWRDADPSGAASIEWYHRWATTGDPALRQRLLDYNEDDCRATRVLLEGLRELEAGPVGWNP